MLAKVSSKNQITLPKRLVDKMGFGPTEERYLHVEMNGSTVFLKPVTVTIEEKIPEEKWERFEKWALDHQNDVSFDSADKATSFLKKRLKKK